MIDTQNPLAPAPYWMLQKWCVYQHACTRTGSPKLCCMMTFASYWPSVARGQWMPYITAAVALHPRQPSPERFGAWQVAAGRMGMAGIPQGLKISANDAAKHQWRLTTSHLLTIFGIQDGNMMFLLYQFHGFCQADRHFLGLGAYAEHKLSLDSG